MPKNLKLTIFTIALLLFSLILTVKYSGNLVISGSESETNTYLATGTSLPDDYSAPFTQLTMQTLFADNFDDNSFNENLWTKIQVDGGIVNERNGALHVSTPSRPFNFSEIGYYGNWSQAGYMTNLPFSISPNQMFETSVNVTELDSVAEVSLMISDQKITNLDPINASNWYRLLKIKDTHYPDQHLAMVESRINGGNVTVKMEGPWASAKGQLKIQVFNNSIAFYENGVLRYIEPYLLPSDSCYVSIFTSSMGCFFGTDSFDDFLVQSSVDVTPTPSPTPPSNETANSTVTPTPPPTSQPTPTPSLSNSTIDVAHNIFSLSSNSTITQFSFDSETKNLTFTAQGPSGTQGYVKLEVPKTLLSDISTLKAYLDNAEMSFSSESQNDSWLISLTYSHSSHYITLVIGKDVSQTSAVTNDLQCLSWVAPIAVIAGLAVVAVATFNHRSKLSNRRF
jgi:hypothetical protein